MRTHCRHYQSNGLGRKSGPTSKRHHRVLVDHPDRGVGLLASSSDELRYLSAPLNDLISDLLGTFNQQSVESSGATTTRIPPLPQAGGNPDVGPGDWTVHSRWSNLVSRNMSMLTECTQSSNVSAASSASRKCVIKIDGLGIADGRPENES